LPAGGEVRRATRGEALLAGFTLKFVAFTLRLGLEEAPNGTRLEEAEAPKGTRAGRKAAEVL